jgi:hypothetical protein
MRDFTFRTYKLLLEKFSAEGYSFQLFDEFINNPLKQVVITRHDIDARQKNALHIARLQHTLGIRGTYYFRAGSIVSNRNIILQIYAMGHEVGYHYEDFARRNGNYDLAIKDFETNLEKLRKIVPVSTICMHGSPLSSWDSRLLWGKYNYRDYGIIGEPYFDVDFNRVMYLTDTGMRWDGANVSIRDKVDGVRFVDKQIKLSSTYDIIDALGSKALPDQIMMTFHPQRWNDHPLIWTEEYVSQKFKNIFKRFLVK